MKPILFNTEMVRAILAGRKTVTRRVVKPQPKYIKSPYKPGDILYVRETWNETTHGYNYKASPHGNSRDTYPWRPSLHMPKEAARIFLLVTSVRVERLQDCGNAQAKDEGFTCCSQFARLWDSTIKPADLPTYGWEANPWVWVIEFERCEKPEEERE